MDDWESGKKTLLRLSLFLPLSHSREGTRPGAGLNWAGLVDGEQDRGRAERRPGHRA